jgi:hypothetical protein
MDTSLVPSLRKAARKIIRHASKPGGSIENGTFTMKIARRSIALEMGLEEGGLDGVKWKEVVKKEVEDCMVSGLVGDFEGCDFEGLTAGYWKGDAVYQSRIVEIQ